MYDEDNDYFAPFLDEAVSEIIKASAKLIEGSYYEAGY